MRIICFIIFSLVAYLGPIWLLIPIAFLYAMMFRNAYEIMLPAFFIDAQFGLSGALWGLEYTLSVGLMLFIAECIKPYLRFHTTLV